MTDYGKSVTIQDVIDLGEALIRISDRYPTRFFTERDFFPLVYAYLLGRVPRLDTEVQVEGGDVDFRIGGSNPALIELAVAPRNLQDACAPDLTFPGHGKALQLYATQNVSELQKLSAVPQAKAKGRFLLLLDFMDVHTKESLKEKYVAAASKLSGVRPVRVVYVSRGRTFHFSVSAP